MEQRARSGDERPIRRRAFVATAAEWTLTRRRRSSKSSGANVDVDTMPLSSGTMIGVILFCGAAVMLSTIQFFQRTRFIKSVQTSLNLFGFFGFFGLLRFIQFLQASRIEELSF